MLRLSFFFGTSLPRCNVISLCIMHEIFGELNAVLRTRKRRNLLRHEKSQGYGISQFGYGMASSSSES